MKVLAIETSCDETSAAVVENGCRVLSNVISSQIDFHRKFGGVVPELASRHHLEAVNPVVAQALDEAGVGFDAIDLIAVTRGPGLVGALLVGVSAAKAYAFAAGKPLIGVHHIHGHVCANFIGREDFSFPTACLTVSGGHTSLLVLKSPTDITEVGKTLDDAAGEAFDKISRFIGAGYPGGPAIEKLALTGDPDKYKLPRPKMHEGDFDFSFSGLKSAVINLIHNMQQKGEQVDLPSLAASFQQAVVDVLVSKAVTLAKQEQLQHICLSGGVAANGKLRERMAAEASLAGLGFSCPELVYCTDNAAMIAVAGYFAYKNGKSSDLTLNAQATLAFSGII